MKDIIHNYYIWVDSSGMQGKVEGMVEASEAAPHPSVRLQPGWLRD